jgi:LysR family transcriptional activator of nhaA
MINLNHLRYFYVCAQLKSVTRAAEILEISQPSLSQQIKAFESNIGFELFFRNGKTFELTPRGKVLYEKSEDLFRSADRVSDFVHKKNETDKRSYSIAVADEVERPFIAEITGKLMHDLDLNLSMFKVVSKSAKELSEEFLNNKFDLFVTSQKLDVEPFRIFEFPVNIVTSISMEKVHHLRGSAVSAVIAGLNQAFVLPCEGMLLRDEINSLLSEVDVKPVIAFESNILACVTRAVQKGVGFSFIPLPYIYEAYRNGLVSVLGPRVGFWFHKIYLYKNAQEEDKICDGMARIIQSYIP